MSPHKILFCVTEDIYFATHRFHFAQEAIRKGYQVAVACHISNKQKLFEKAGIQVFPTPFRRESFSPFVVLKTCRHLRRLIKSYQPQIIHAVALRAIFITWLATLGMKRPLILNAVAGFGSLYSKDLKPIKLKIARFIADILFKKVFKQSTAYNVLQNHDDLNIFSRNKLAHKDRLFLIRGAGVDLKAWDPQDEPSSGKPVILFVGRLLKDKGLAELVAASQILRKRNLPHIIRVIGTSDSCNPESLTQECVQQWHDHGVIEWLKHRDDVLLQMSQAQIIALPSYYREGLPKVLLEAGLARRAVITCNSIGCREVVSHMDNGLLVSPKNVTSLADAIEKLLKNPSLRAQLAQRNYERICTEFSSDIIYRQFFDLYKKILMTADLEYPQEINDHIAPHTHNHHRISFKCQNFTSKELTQIANMHTHCIHTGFLSSIGAPFLRKLYDAISHDKAGILIIALHRGKVIGFASGTTFIRSLYNYLLKHHFISLAFILFPKIFSSDFPSKMLEVILYALKHPHVKNDTQKTKKHAELLSIAVDENYRGHGVAQSLFHHLASEFAKRNVFCFKIVVGSNLTPAQKFYKKMGATIQSTIELHRGEKSFVYHYEKSSS